jgi:methionine synthase II (cobalamin-independent)
MAGRAGGRAAPADQGGGGPDEALAPGVDPGEPRVEDPNDVAARILAAIERHPPAAVWASAGPGLDALQAEAAEGKLRALVEGVRLARLVLAKEQFER